MPASRDKILKAREAIGGLLSQAAQYELDAYNGSTGSEYDRLYEKIEKFRRDVK